MNHAPLLEQPKQPEYPPPLARPEATLRPSPALDSTPWGEPDAVVVGRRIGRYTVLHEIGRGAMGRVLRAYDPKLQRDVALKVMRARKRNTELPARMVREARAMAQLSHPGVVVVHDVEQIAGGVVIVMEYVRGLSLSAWLDRRQPSWSEIVERFVQAGRGLAQVHACGLMHRDFKPGNVLIPAHGPAKVTDFGLATLHAEPAPSRQTTASDWVGDDRLTLTGRSNVVGTPRYMAPEQHFGDPLDTTVDQYAFCVALWEALLGQPPFMGSVDELATQKQQGPPPWPPGDPTPSSVVRALRRGLAPSPGQRWRSLDGLLDALERHGTPPRPKAPRSRVLAGTLGLLVGGTTVHALNTSATSPAPSATIETSTGRTSPERTSTGRAYDTDRTLYRSTTSGPSVRSSYDRSPLREAASTQSGRDHESIRGLRLP